MSNEPKRTPLSDTKDIVGRYIVAFCVDRDGDKVKRRSIPVKVLAMTPAAKDGDKNMMQYEVLSGDEKGEVREGEYNPAQSADVYDDSNIILAPLGM
jgi:hypothetical protein